MCLGSCLLAGGLEKNNMFQVIVLIIFLLIYSFLAFSSILQPFIYWWFALGATFFIWRTKIKRDVVFKASFLFFILAAIVTLCISVEWGEILARHSAVLFVIGCIDTLLVYNRSNAKK